MGSIFKLWEQTYTTMNKHFDIVIGVFMENKNKNDSALTYYEVDD